jgi:hypothetical protein
MRNRVFGINEGLDASIGEKRGGTVLVGLVRFVGSVLKVEMDRD